MQAFVPGRAELFYDTWNEAFPGTPSEAAAVVFGQVNTGPMKPGLPEHTAAEQRVERRNQQVPGTARLVPKEARVPIPKYVPASSRDKYPHDTMALNIQEGRCTAWSLRPGQLQRSAYPAVRTFPCKKHQHVLGVKRSERREPR